MLKFCFTRNMGFGQWLREKRKAAKLSQLQLATRATDLGFPVTDAYVSMIEREYDKNKKGLPTRVNQDLVIAFARILDMPINDALLAAGYAPATSKHIVGGHEIELPGDVASLMLYTDIKDESDLEAFKESFRIAYEITKLLLDLSTVKSPDK